MYTKKKGYLLLEITMLLIVTMTLLPVTFKFIEGTSIKAASRDTKLRTEYIAYSIANHYTGYTSSALSKVTSLSDIETILELTPSFKDNLEVTIDANNRTVLCVINEHKSIYKIP